MSQSSQGMIPSNSRFTCPLAYVLVDGKQVANGDVDLVVKSQPGMSPAFTSRAQQLPSSNRYTLMVYVAKEAVPKFSLGLDGFISPAISSSEPIPAMIRYSSQRRRLLIKAGCGSTSSPIYDLRFSKAGDLQDAVSRLTSIGVKCEDDDRHTAAPRSQSSIGFQHATPTRHFILSPDMMKAGRVPSPLLRRPDGSTPAFALIQVPKTRHLTRQSSIQEQSSQERPALFHHSEETMPHSRSETRYTSRPASVPAGTQRYGYVNKLERIPPPIQRPISGRRITSIPDCLSPTSSGRGYQGKGLSPATKRDNGPWTEETDESTSAHIKRRRMDQSNGRSGSSWQDPIEEAPFSQETSTQMSGQDAESELQSWPTILLEQSQSSDRNPMQNIMVDAASQVGIQDTISAALTTHFWTHSMSQITAWEQLRETFVDDVQSARDDHEVLESLVENYQMDLNERLGAASIF